jgi:diphosphomevalonate decarboxylase
LRHQLEKENADIPKLSHFALRIISENNFPTAAGLASSAAGLAALVRAMADLYELPQDSTVLSRIARRGSGSACRSLFRGYVAWNMGERLNGSDSVAVQLAPASHWPEMSAIILIVNARKKDVSSTSGMKRTVATLELFRARAETVVPRSIKQMEKAIHDKDFEAFGNITMRESNSFHATCLDTSPPIVYLNDVSRAVMKVVEAINSAARKIIAAYTFDAGPNTVIFYEKKNSDAVSGTFSRILKRIRENNVENIDEITISLLKMGVSRVILTSVGEGPTRAGSLIK